MRLVSAILAAALAGAAQAQTFTQLVSFDHEAGFAKGINPRALVRDPATGKLLLTMQHGGNEECSGGCGAYDSFDPSAHGGKALERLHALDESESNYPTSRLLPSDDGALYGTSIFAAFKLVRKGKHWKFDTLHDFHGEAGLAGSTPLIDPATGTLYGTTCQGGEHGAGTLFSLTPDGGNWTYATELSFDGAAGGRCPRGLIRDAAGNLYGAAGDGGDPDCEADGCGVVFQLRFKHGRWHERVLHTFTGLGGDGRTPGDLTLDAKGNLYGAALTGGEYLDPCFVGCGNVFMLSKRDGWTMTVLHQFDFQNGAQPLGPLTFDAKGNLYGTTEIGGPKDSGADNHGTVFALVRNKNGFAFRTLYFFCSEAQCADGREPLGGVQLDASGTLYGTTFAGGTGDAGTLFALKP